MKYGLYVRKSSEDSSKQVQSIENQIQVLRSKAQKDNLKISKVYQEEKSAKVPEKRSEFNQMVADLEAGIIDGIICWKLDRLSRNPIDGGKIQYLLQTSTIKQIITYEKTYFPSDNSVMMSIELGMATEYSLALGKNVKRGMNYKVDKGHYPNTAPIGYLNTSHLNCGEKTIITDSDRAPLIRKLWDLLLENDLSIKDLVQKAADIGLRTRATRKSPEKKLTRHGLHCIFKNPFYYGYFRWGNELHNGSHEPVVTKEEFDKAQKIIANRKSKAKPAKHKYAFKGPIRCGECGASVTAEQKNKNRKDGSINQRTYYRCTHRLKDSDCNQPTIREEELEKQFMQILNTITIPESFVKWAAKWLEDQNEESATKRDVILEQQKKQIQKISKEIDRLLDLRLQDEIEADIFKAKKDSLVAEQKAIEREISLGLDSNSERIDKVVEVFEFCQKAKQLFEESNYENKIHVLKALGSQFYLKDKKLTVELAKPFKLIHDAVKEEWILNPWFATLKTKTAQSENTLERSLYVNGAALVDKVRHLCWTEFVNFKSLVLLK